MRVLNTERPASWPNLGRLWPSASRSIGRPLRCGVFSRSSPRYAIDKRYDDFIGFTRYMTCDATLLLNCGARRLFVLSLLYMPLAVVACRAGPGAPGAERKRNLRGGPGACRRERAHRAEVWGAVWGSGTGRRRGRRGTRLRGVQGTYKGRGCCWSEYLVNIV